MRKLSALIVFAALLVGCGDKQEEAPAPSPAQAEATPDQDLEGYPEGVKKYYGEVHSEPTGDEAADVEAEYHQPPKPAEAALGETITLTGTNIGIRQRVTVTAVDDLAEYTAVRLKLENTGITVYEAPLRNAALTFADGEPQPPAHDAKASCNRNFDTESLRIDVGASARGCLLFPRGEQPERFQLALEIVPTDAGGIWNLR